MTTALPRAPSIVSSRALRLLVAVVAAVGICVVAGGAPGHPSADARIEHRAPHRSGDAASVSSGLRPSRVKLITKRATNDVSGVWLAALSVAALALTRLTPDTRRANRRAITLFTTRGRAPPLLLRS
jgi:hypothetical protein